jgi:hypothetical protein
VIFPIRQTHLQANQNPHRKIGKKNHPKCRKQPNCPTSGSYSFLHRSQNRARLVPLERKQCRHSIDTRFEQIRVSKNLQLSVQKRSNEEGENSSKSDKTRRASNQRSLRNIMLCGARWCSSTVAS